MSIQIIKCECGNISKEFSSDISSYDIGDYGSFSFNSQWKEFNCECGRDVWPEETGE